MENPLQNEQLLQTQSNLLMSAVEHSSSSIVITDKNGVIEYVNPKFTSLTGYTSSEACGKNPRMLQSGKTPAAQYAELWQTIAAGKEWHGIFHNLKKNGESFWESASIAPVFNAQGEITHFIAVKDDITEKMTREIKMGRTAQYLDRMAKGLAILNKVSSILSSSLDLHNILTNALQVLIQSTGADCGAVLLFNNEKRKFVLEAVTGENIQDIPLGTLFSRSDGAAGAAFKSGKPVIVNGLDNYNFAEKKVLAEHGIANFVSAPIKAQNSVMGVLHVAYCKPHQYSEDQVNLLMTVTEQFGLAINNARLFEETKSTLDELKKTQSYLVQSEKMASIGQLAAGVAHEINNPTGFVQSNLNTLSKYMQRIAEMLTVYSQRLADLPRNSAGTEKILAELEEKKKSLKIDYILEDIQNVIKESLEGTNRIKRIVNDLKSFSHVDQQETKPADINRELDSTINVVWNELKYKCTIDKQYGQLPNVNCNAGQLKQVFANLLINAAQAIEKKGTITIQTHYEDWTDTVGVVKINISDTGCGIDPDKINRIFEPFFTTKEVGKGTGLGLSIAYDIIKKHNGNITVKSTRGRGTTFSMVLPTDAMQKVSE